MKHLSSERIQEASIDIVGLQEVKRLDQGHITVKAEDGTAYNVYWKGRIKLRQHGVGIVIKICNYIKAKDVEFLLVY